MPFLKKRKHGYGLLQTADCLLKISNKFEVNSNVEIGSGTVLWGEKQTLIEGEDAGLMLSQIEKAGANIKGEFSRSLPCSLSFSKRLQSFSNLFRFVRLDSLRRL